MFRLYLDLFGFLPFAPPVLAALGALASLQFSRRRWIVHTITLVAMASVLPVYIHFLGVLERSSLQYPGPGDAFIWMLYMIVLLPTVLVYWLFSHLMRKRPDRSAQRELNDVWEFRDGQMHAVGDGPLIDDLIEQKLFEVRKADWAILYLHKETGEYWELTYPKSEMQGGGPRRLRTVSDPDDWVPYPAEHR